MGCCFGRSSPSSHVNEKSPLINSSSRKSGGYSGLYKEGEEAIVSSSSAVASRRINIDERREDRIEVVGKGRGSVDISASDLTSRLDAIVKMTEAKLIDVTNDAQGQSISEHQLSHRERLYKTLSSSITNLDANFAIFGALPPPRSETPKDLLAPPFILDPDVLLVQSITRNMDMYLKIAILDREDAVVCLPEP